MMPTISKATNAGNGHDASETPPGLFRWVSLASGPAGTVTNLFANLRDVKRGEIIAEHPDRHLQGARINVERTHGRGTWEFYRLDHALYLVAADGVYDVPRAENVPGEGLVEFHLRLSGFLEIAIPGERNPMVLKPSTLLILYQPVGADVSVRVKAGPRETGVSLYCRPSFLRELMRRSGIARWPVIEAIEAQSPKKVWYRQYELSSALRYIACSVLECPYRGGIRLLHAEAKALELLCDVLAAAQSCTDTSRPNESACDLRQFDAATRLLASNLSSPLKVRDVARAVGMCETKLKRIFKSRLGVTVFDYALDCRMRHALNLLRCKRMSVGDAARAVGYRHQTSFSSAFQEHFGFLPSKARTELH